MNLTSAWLPPRASDPQLWHHSCSSSNISLSLSGDEPVNTVSINQVLSNANLISFNKFVQVQGCEEKVGMAGDSKGDRVRGSGSVKAQAGTGPDRGAPTPPLIQEKWGVSHVHVRRTRIQAEGRAQTIALR